MTKCPKLASSVLLLAMVAACGGTAASMSSGGPAARVSGTVVDADGEPAANVRVQIGDVVTTTDVDGRFAVEGVGPTYDAAMVARAPHAYVFEGLSTRTPTLRLFDLSLSMRSQEARVHVALADRLPRTGKIVVTARPEDDARVADVHATAAEDGGVDVSVRWIGAPRARMTLVALAYEADEETLAPARYLGVATETTTLEHRGAARWDASLAPVATDVVRAHAAPAAGHAMQWTSLYLDLGPSARRTKIADRLGAETDASFLVPELDGARFAVEAIASSKDDLAIAAEGGLDAGHRDARLALPVAPALVAPADGATSVSRETELSWAPSQPVSWVYVGPEDQASASPADAQVWIATADRQTHIPDLRALGIDLPRRAHDAWYVVAARGASSVEDAAQAGLFVESPGAGGNTSARRFTTE